MKLAAVVLGLPLLLAGCGGSALGPAPLDTKNDQCASCRMTVSQRPFASQIVARGEEPRFFDDLACLAAYLREHPPAAGAAIFVADHRTGAFAPAGTALYTRVPSLETPMGSHLVAHADASSRAADAPAANGTPVERRELLGR